MSHESGLVTAFYRALLRLYPASFGADYGTALTRTFEETIAAVPARCWPPWPM